MLQKLIHELEQAEEALRLLKHIGSFGTLERNQTDGTLTLTFQPALFADQEGQILARGYLKVSRLLEDLKRDTSIDDWTV